MKVSYSYSGAENVCLGPLSGRLIVVSLSWTMSKGGINFRRMAQRSRISSLLLMIACLMQSFTVVDSYHLSRLGFARASVRSDLIDKGLYMSRNRNSMAEDVVVTEGIAGAVYGGREYSSTGFKIPSPLHQVVDFNVDRRSVVYELVLGRDMGIDIDQGNGYAYVSAVHEDSRAAEMGIKVNDIIVSTSATAGDQLWAHDSEASVKSALNTRFVMSPTVVIRFERPLSEIPENILTQLKVPYEFSVKVKRPIGLHVVEGPGKSVNVQYIKPEGGAARARRMEVGDQIIEMSASWGDRMWEVNSVESFVVGVKMRTSDTVTFKIRRMVPLDVYTGQATTKKQKGMSREKGKRADSPRAGQKDGAPASAASGTDVAEGGGSESKLQVKARSAETSINSIKNIAELSELWESLKTGSESLQQITVNKIMSKALQLEEPFFAADIFEETFDYSCVSRADDPAESILKLVEHVDLDQTMMVTVDDGKGDGSTRSTRKVVPKGKFRSKAARGEAPMLPYNLEPNNYVCTTAAKAYGRLGAKNVDKALGLVPWLESRASEKPDVYFLTSVLYVCAKHKRVKETENIFWDEIPKRGLAYTVATTNSLMYMYARMGRPDDALKVYELTKRIGLTCTVVTYGVLIKALLRSGKKALQDTAFEILRSLPELNISPGVEVYNQFFEHYAKMHDFRKVKMILRLMSDSKPRTRPDAVSYGHLIHCFAESRKPRSALSVYHQMLKRNIEPSSYTYMGILKALSHMRDGISCVQVIGEMRERGITPTKKHYAMTMFACLTSNQCLLAESIFDMYVKLGNKPDTALYTLRLRAQLQQNKWDEGMELFEDMRSGGVPAKPNLHTLNTLLQFQVLDGKYDKAQTTLDMILKEQEKAKAKAKGGGGIRLADTLKSLSFAMGPYSSHVQAIQRDDSEFGGIEALGLDLRGSVYGVGVSGIQDSVASGPLIERLDAKPSRDGLHFLVSSAEHLERSTDTAIQGDFYMQVLRAVVLEGHQSLAKRLLVLRDDNKIAMKEADIVRAQPIEDLARRGLANAGAPSNL